MTMNPDKYLEDILKVVASEKQLINDNTPAIDIFDFDYFGRRLDNLHAAFPEPFFLHAMAMKANSLRGILKFALEKGAKGSECASISEAIHAVATGFKPENVVYDSPCKTKVYSLCRIFRQPACRKSNKAHNNFNLVLH